MKRITRVILGLGLWTAAVGFAIGLNGLGIGSVGAAPTPAQVTGGDVTEATVVGGQCQVTATASWQGVHGKQVVRWQLNHVSGTPQFVINPTPISGLDATWFPISGRDGAVRVVGTVNSRPDVSSLSIIVMKKQGPSLRFTDVTAVAIDGNAALCGA